MPVRDLAYILPFGDHKDGVTRIDKELRWRFVDGSWFLYFPESRAIGRLIRTKKQLAHLHLCLLALTPFTFFGARSADKLAQEEHEKRLNHLESSLRTELDAAEKYLPTMLNQ